MLDSVPDLGATTLDGTTTSGIVIRVRSLPDGGPHQGSEIGWNGRSLEIELPGQDLPVGTLLEIESDSKIYWGELKQRTGSRQVVLVEHAVDRARLAWLEKTWV
jgi:hypothetical protein